MNVNTYKSLYKPLLWGGIPREYFILIALFSILSVMVFQSLKACLPILAIYGIMVLLNRIDAKILTILKENLAFKHIYFH